MGNMIAQNDVQISFDNSKLKNSTFIVSVGGGETTNPLWTSEVGNAEFRGAIEQSLLNHGLLSKNALSSKYLLKVSLLKVDQPMFGFDLTVTSEVNYLLLRKKINEVVYENSISAPFTATVGDSFLAVERLRLANEGSIRENIKKFLIQLSVLDLKQAKR